MMKNCNDVRSPTGDEQEALAQLWFTAWRDGHASILPAEVVQARTLENFRARLPAMMEDIGVIGEPGSPVGFYRLHGEELEQFFVAAGGRGSGVATTLIRAAERALHDRGVRVAWLACAIGNQRAARFYKKSGWTMVGPRTTRLDLSGREYLLDVWAFEKRLMGERCLRIQC